MSFYDDASLVVIPSAQKTSKLYSVKPTDGSGDLAFTRTGDTATRVNSAGLIEKVRTNLVRSSGDISTQSTYWTSNQSGSTTQNAAVAPDGTTTAAQITSAGSAYSGVQQSSISVAAVPHTYSCYLKAVSGTPTIRLTFYDGVTFHQGNFTITSEWVRYSFTFTPLAGSFAVYNTCSSVNTWLAWGAQLESGDIATDYIATTTAAVSVGPVANVPRLDYLGSTCPRLILEGQRTNSQRASEQLNNALYWSTGGGTISANLTTSPDGNQNADKFVESATTARHELYSDSLAFSGTSSVSIFAKNAGRRYFSAITGGDPSLGGATFDLQTGEVTATSGGTAASITPYGNGWYRCTFTTTRTNTSQVYFCLRTTGGTPTVETYAGDGTSGIFFWGCQVELAGAYATSYIPTVAASATRGADACSKTGISSLIGQTEGTLFVEFVNDGNSNSSIDRIISLSDGTANNRLYVARQSAGTPYFVSVTGGSLTGEITGGTALPQGAVKIAVAYKNNDVAMYVNGSLIGTDLTHTTPATSNLYLGQENAGTTSNLWKPYNQALLFKTRLTNAELAELTTL